MGENSKIEWTHHTFNPWRGCTKVSPGCANCYAETLSGRNHAVLGEWGKTGTRVIASEAMWREPVKWNKEAAAAGERRRVFCASLADVFEGPDTMPESALPAVVSARARLMHMIEATPLLDWLLLTKRPENVMRLLPDGFKFPANIWIGTSVENQEMAEKRIPELLKVPARVRFLSMEPLLGPVGPSLVHRKCYQCEKPSEYLGWNILGYNFHKSAVYCNNCGYFMDTLGTIDWVIVGGESGPKARPINADWVRSIRDRCKRAEVPFFMKQMDKKTPIPDDLMIREFPTP